MKEDAKEQEREPVLTDREIKKGQNGQRKRENLSGEKVKLSDKSHREEGVYDNDHQLMRTKLK